MPGSKKSHAPLRTHSAPVRSSNAVQSNKHWFLVLIQVLLALVRGEGARRRGERGAVPSDKLLTRLILNCCVLCVVARFSIRLPYAFSRAVLLLTRISLYFFSSEYRRQWLASVWRRCQAIVMQQDVTSKNTPHASLHSHLAHSHHNAVF